MDRKRRNLDPLPLFEGLRRRGRPSEKPIGVPECIWATIQKRQQRGGLRRRKGTPEALTWTAHDILELVRKHRMEPIGTIRKRPSTPEPPPQVVVVAVETVAFPKDTSSPITIRLIKEGRIPGVRWDPERGGVRTAHVRRLA